MGSTDGSWAISDFEMGIRVCHTEFCEECSSAKECTACASGYTLLDSKDCYACFSGEEGCIDTSGGCKLDTKETGVVISFLILFLSILYLNDLVYTNFSLSLDTKIEYNYFFDPFDQSATNWNLVELHAITSAPTTCDE